MAISNLRYQTNARERFELEVLEGVYVGSYEIKKFSEFDDFETFVDRSTEFYGVENFILGDKLELSVFESFDPQTFNLIRNVYDELGGDGQIVFKWFVIDPSGMEQSVLGDDFQINLNTIQTSLGLESKLKLSFEIKKREDQNKFNARKDITVNLLSDVNLDNEAIIPVSTETTLFKEQDQGFLQSYFYSNANNEPFLNPDKGGGFIFSSFMATLAKDNQNIIPTQWHIGNFINLPTSPNGAIGMLNPSSSTYTDLKVKINNLRIEVEADVTQPSLFTHFSLNLYKLNSDYTINEVQLLATSVLESNGGVNKTVIELSGDEFNVNFSVFTNERLRLYCELDDFLDDTKARIDFSSNSSVDLIVNTPIIGKKTQGVRLFDALNQISKQYTNSNIILNSNILSNGGRYYDNFIYTGLSFRGVGFEKIQTNFDDFFEKGVALNLALGYDLRANNLKVEDVEFFFKNTQVIDFSDRKFESDSFVSKQANEIFFNSVKTGSKKYSTENDEDLDNFNTVAELTTPIKSKGDKFKIESDIVLDSSKIQELANDGSTATNDGDDDIIMLNIVEVEDFIDTGVFQEVLHIDKNGELVLEQFNENSLWTSFPIEIGDFVEITDPINKGTFEVIDITTSALTLDVSGMPIIRDTRTTTIKLFLGDIIKNRSNEGFLTLTGVEDPSTITNAIHDPIRQALRFYPIWGSGLTKKALNESIIVNDYKNNGNVTTKVDPSVFPDEYLGQLTLDQNITLQQIRDNGIYPLFSGEYIEITIKYVTWFEFFEAFNTWRYGENDDSDSFGYFTVNTPLGVRNIFPWGEQSISHNRASNSFTIKGFTKFEI